MGLSVSVGDYAAILREEPADALWFDEQFAILNQALRNAGLSEHIEPREMPDLQYESCISFPYSFLHYLRRMYARQQLDKPPQPVDGEDLSKSDEADIEQVFSRGDSHLLYHSDCVGFYVPQHFPRPIEDDRVLGGAVGSTQGLYGEILGLAPLIGIELNGDGPTPAALAELAEADDSHPYHIERIVWHALYENCVHSLEYSGVIAFT